MNGARRSTRKMTQILKGVKPVDSGARPTIAEG